MFIGVPVQCPCIRLCMPNLNLRFFPYPGKETDPEQECKIKPNLFSVSVEVEQEQARKDKSIAVTPDHLSSAFQTFKKRVLNGQFLKGKYEISSGPFLFWIEVPFGSNLEVISAEPRTCLIRYY